MGNSSLIRYYLAPLVIAVIPFSPRGLMAQGCTHRAVTTSTRTCTNILPLYDRNRMARPPGRDLARGNPGLYLWSGES